MPADQHKPLHLHPEAETDNLLFRYMPAYAQFLLNGHLEEISGTMLRISREMNVPLLHYFDSMPEEELTALSVQGTRQLLEAFARNQMREFIDMSLQTWLGNRIPLIQFREIAVEDILTISFVRKKSFREFLPRYNAGLETSLAIMEEMDRYLFALEKISYKTLFDLKEQKINEHHYFIEKINNTSPGVLYVFDLLEQKEIYTNHKRGELLGYSEEDMKEMGSNILGLIIHPDDLPGALEHIQRYGSAADGEMRTMEYRIRHKNGTYIWQRAYETVFKRTPEGRPSQIIGIAIDITREKEAAYQLEHSAQLLREAQEIAGMGSFEWDLTGTDSVYSSQMMKIFGMNGSSDLMSFLEYVHPSDRQKVREAIEKAIRGDDIYECEYRYLKDGAEKVIWSRGIVAFQDGKPKTMKGTVMDVTQRHHMLKRLERSEELHKQAQALAHIGNWSWFIAENRIDWSDEMYRIYGLEPQAEKIDFERFISFTHPDDRPKRLEEIRQALETGHADDYTMRIVRADGTVKILQGKGEVLTDEHHKPYKLLGTCQDVTQQFLLNKQLAQKNAELERSNQELMAFNYISSHDLKEPVRKIKVFTNLILGRKADEIPEDVRHGVERITAAANHMQKLLESLLTFTRATTLNSILKQVDLNEILEEVKTALKDEIEEKGASITASALPVLNVIPFQFQQLFENLLGNALKYSREGIAPRIEVSAGMISGREVPVEGANPAAQYHAISVADNGIGFDQKYAGKIFELFQRLHGKDEYSGTGIGLAICKKIVENHHGFITADSKEEEGSTFRIYLPA